MFIQKADLPTVIYGYQLDEITEGDDALVVANCAAAIEEVKSYLRTLYDVPVIFGATGAARNPLILEHTKNVALWYIIRLANVDIIHKQALDRYDRTIKWLVGVKDGTIAPDLPHLTNGSGDVTTKTNIGSNPKFKHHY